METPPTREQSEEEAARWILRRDSPAWSDADQASLEQWLEAWPGNRVSYIRLGSTWRDLDLLKPLVAEFPRGVASSREALEEALKGHKTRGG